ncbi:MAG: hypothetical protein ACK4QW_03775 [Alphaproteobacteria bacterium]
MTTVTKRPAMGLLALLSIALPAADAGATARSCARVGPTVEHRPEPGVAYRPGRDVGGRPVAPADLGGPAIDLPEVPHFEVTVDLPRGRRGGGRIVPGGEALVGILTLLPNGGLLFNGRPVEPAEDAALRAACGPELDRR